jgi:molecular chaperone DnaK
MLVGIDLGTTFSAVARIDKATGQPKIIPNREGKPVTPSVIQFSGDGLIFGWEAKEAFDAGDTNCVTAFKRGMGKTDSSSNWETYCTIEGKNYSAVDLSALLLKHLKEDAEAVIGEPIEEAVISVPAYFLSKEIDATKQAAKQAGLSVRKIIKEPTAAAIAYGLGHWRENALVLVYDLGGGTFDVTLVAMKNNNELDTIGISGDHYLGGRNWDERLGNFLTEKVQEEIGTDPASNLEMMITITRTAEACKKKLTQMTVVKNSISLPGYGKCSIDVSREEFDSLTADLLDKTGSLCETVLRNANAKWSDITDILLVGGSTRMPQVSIYLQKLSGKTPISHVNPDEAVALGAAVQTTLPDAAYTVLKKKDDGSQKAKGNIMPVGLRVGEEKKISTVSSLRVRDVTGHALGIIAVNAIGDAYINETIIPANFPIPVKSARAFNFYTSSREENELEIYVLQGEKNRWSVKYLTSSLFQVFAMFKAARLLFSTVMTGTVLSMYRHDRKRTQ